MKTQLKKLNRISKFIDLDDFREVNIQKNSINLYAYYTSELTKKYDKYFDFTISKTSGIITGHRYDIWFSMWNKPNV